MSKGMLMYQEQIYLWTGVDREMDGSRYIYATGVHLLMYGSTYAYVQKYKHQTIPVLASASLFRPELRPEKG